MSTPREKQYIQVASQTIQVTESSTFTALLGSNVNPKWAEWLMKYSGTYSFSIALILKFLGLGISIYQFLKSPNKTLNQQSNLAWNIIQTAGAGVAIFGTLVAASLFAVITPAIFITTLALDTFRNIGLFLWNIGKLASLRFQLSEKLHDPEDHLTKLKYQALKKEYLNNIKQHGIGSIVGLLITAAMSVIFLFPHISLGAVGATVVTVGAIKLSITAISAITASSALILPLAPVAFEFSKWLLPKIGNGIKNAAQKIFSFFKGEKVQEDHPSEESVAEQKIKPILPTEKNPNYKISDSTQLNKEIREDDINVKTFNRRFRETIIDHIEDKEIAKNALLHWVNDKMKILKGDLQRGKNNNTFFGERERPKREQKLHALLLIKKYFQQDKEEEEDVFTNNKSYFKNFELLQKEVASIDALINFIETNLPGVKQSYFLQQSDTQNVIEALKLYAYKFPENQVSLQLN